MKRNHRMGSKQRSSAALKMSATNDTGCLSNASTVARLQHYWKYIIRVWRINYILLYVIEVVFKLNQLDLKFDQLKYYAILHIMLYSISSWILILIVIQYHIKWCMKLMFFYERGIFFYGIFKYVLMYVCTYVFMHSKPIFILL